MKILNTIFLLLFVCVEVCAQRPGEHENGNFVYEDNTDKVIVGLSQTGVANIRDSKEIYLLRSSWIL